MDYTKLVGDVREMHRAGLLSRLEVDLADTIESQAKLIEELKAKGGLVSTCSCDAYRQRIAELEATGPVGGSKTEHTKPAACSRRPAPAQLSDDEIIDLGLRAQLLCGHSSGVVSYNGDFGDDVEPQAIAFARAILARCLPDARATEDTERLNHVIKTLNEVLHDQAVRMQAAVIEYRHGAGAEAGMAWIENGLCGPGLLPDEDAPYGKEAQAFYDANKSNPFPSCFCGRPSNILWMGKGFCCDLHYKQGKAEHDAAMAIAQGG